MLAPTHNRLVAGSKPAGPTTLFEFKSRCSAAGAIPLLWMIDPSFSSDGSIDADSRLALKRTAHMAVCVHRQRDCTVAERFHDHAGVNLVLARTADIGENFTAQRST
jgi:hypothetical protein